jgi:hypothetical protein
MTVDEITIEPGDPNSPYKGKSGPRKFSNIEVAIFVGLLVGCAFIGLYLIGIGINSIIEPPKVVANGSIGETPFYYIDNYYKSDKRNEVTIYNYLPVGESWVWVGSPEEYLAWKDMKLMDGKTHEFKSDGRFLIEGIKYKTIMRYYDLYDDVLRDTFVGYKQQIMFVTNDKTNGTRIFKIYEADIKGNLTAPEFTIVETDLQPTFAEGVYATAK